REALRRAAPTRDRVSSAGQCRRNSLPAVAKTTETSRTRVGLRVLLRTLLQPLVQPRAYVVRRHLGALALVAGDHHTGGRHAGEPGDAEPLPQLHAMI